MPLIQPCLYFERRGEILHALILALHEDPKNSVDVSKCLEESGHSVILVKTFTEAIRIVQEKHVDLIISDVHLENGGNVFDFLRWVRKNPASKETPFVLFSSTPTPVAKYFEDGLKTTARMLGAAMYISMEIFDAKEFRKKIDSLLPPVDPVLELSPQKIGE